MEGEIDARKKQQEKAAICTGIVLMNRLPEIAPILRGDMY